MFNRFLKKKSRNEVFHLFILNSNSYRSVGLWGFRHRRNFVLFLKVIGWFTFRRGVLKLLQPNSRIIVGVIFHGWCCYKSFQHHCSPDYQHCCRNCNRHCHHLLQLSDNGAATASSVMSTTEGTTATPLHRSLLTAPTTSTRLTSSELYDNSPQREPHTFSISRES